jgi:hypothetical protein
VLGGSALSAIIAKEQTKTVRWGRLLIWVVAALLILPAAGVAALWAYGPYWIAPVEDFTQGPGGAIAYVSLYNQIQSQAANFWSGGDVHLEMNQAEFSGMLSSALLSGKRPDAPIQKVRTGLLDGQIRVETVLMLPYPSIPERYQGPVGLKLRLRPMVAGNGTIRFQITRATLGRIPIPPQLIQWAGRLYDLNMPGFNANGPSIQLPAGDMIASQLGRSVTIKRFTADEGKLTMVIAMPQKEKLQ